MRIDNTISIIGRIREEANKIIVEELEIRGHHGLAPSHGEIISTLLRNGEMTKTDISNFINRDRSTVTVLVKKLEQLGYIGTRVNEEDSRSFIVFLTEKGRELKKDFIDISEKLYDIEYGDMSEEQIKAFREGLELVYDNFKNR